MTASGRDFGASLARLGARGGAIFPVKNEGFEDFDVFRLISVKTAFKRHLGPIWVRFGSPLGVFCKGHFGGLGFIFFVRNKGF